MDGNVSGENSDNINWDTEDELEIQDIPCSSNTNAIIPRGNAISGNGEASSSAGPPRSILIHHFIAMGFSEKLVTKVIEEHGEGNTESILETLLTYSALDLEKSPKQETVNSDQYSSQDECFLDDLSDSDNCWSGSETNENRSPSSEWKKTLLYLEKMGYSAEDASLAIDRCGPEASIAELTDFLCAAQLVKTEDLHLEEPIAKPKNIYNGKHKKRRLYSSERKKQRNDETNGDDEIIRIPKPMIGYGVPGEPHPNFNRKLPESAIGPPYFYYENVALTPKGVWDTISRFLYGIQPEFVDSKYFCAAARKRGYIHNLPIENRFPLLPIPPRTINDALPLTRRWWPSWDKRTKLNCLKTCIGSARLTERIRKALENSGDGEPSLSVQKYVLDECRKWNLVWVGKNKLAPLECDEVEMLLGFPKNHTRGGGISRTDRYKSLGNSFQVDTVAYHLSVLKDLFPSGINVLSLFSGIGGAEVALYRLGIPLKNVVSVEISDVNQNIVKGWWEQTNQKGTLIHVADVQSVDGALLEKMMNSFGGFDLVIGGSPCNNLAGSNRVSRDGLEGEHSALFHDYYRILELVKCIMNNHE